MITFKTESTSDSTNEESQSLVAYSLRYIMIRLVHHSWSVIEITKLALVVPPSNRGGIYTWLTEAG